MAERIQSGPPPLTAKTLANIKPEIHDQYVKAQSGDGYVRDYMNADDAESQKAYTAEIASGALRVLPAGWTSATERKNAEEAAGNSKAFTEELRKLEAAETAKRKAAMEKKLAEMTARMHNEYGFTPPGVTR